MAVLAGFAGLFLYVKLCSGACNSLQFEINGKCCFMCEPGFYVGRNCTEDTRTDCVPCEDSFYTSGPNHYSECKKCTVCDPGSGVRLKTACTVFSDSVCEVLDEHYCINRTGESCSRALRHTSCSPGHYIVRTGTADRDTVCSGCAEGTFSNGSLHSCQTHSQCEDQGLIVIKPGTNSSDAECGNKYSPALIAGVTAGLIVLVLVVVVAAVAATVIKILKTGSASHSENYHTLNRREDTELEVEYEDPTTVTQMLSNSRSLYPNLSTIWIRGEGSR